MSFRSALIATAGARYFRRLDYLRSTGTQYIDLGIRLDNTCDVEVEFAEPVTKPASGSAGFFGTLLYAGDFYWTYITSGGAVHAGYGSTTSSGFFLNVIKIAIKSGTLYINDVAKQTIGGSFTASAYTATLLALKRGNQNVGNYLSAKLKRCRVWHNSALVMDLIPVLDNSFIACMYDRVNCSFKHNAGTGVFLYE